LEKAKLERETRGRSIENKMLTGDTLKEMLQPKKNVSRGNLDKGDC